MHVHALLRLLAQPTTTMAQAQNLLVERAAYWQAAVPAPT
jgi:hypothetical protein